MNAVMSPCRKSGYALGIYGQMLPWFMQSVFLFYFYTDVLGITPAQTGTIFFLAMLWDALTDPVMGVLADKTCTRWGKYRPYLLFAAIPLGLSFILVFIKPEWPVEKLFLLALVTHLLFRLCFTLTYIPYTAMLAKLSTDSVERSNIAAYKTVATSMGTLTVSLFTLQLVNYFGDGDEAKGFFYTACTYAALLVCALWICFLTTREVGSESPDSVSASYGLLEAGKTILKNTPFLLVFFGVIAFSGCYTIFLKTIMYFFKYNLESAENARWALAAVSASGILAAPIWAAITRRTSKRFVWICGCLLSASSLLVFYLNDTASIPIIVANLFLVACGIAAYLMTFYAMIADTVDYGEWQSGVRVEAACFSLLSFANKASLAFGGGALGYLLSWSGYQANVIQSEAALEGIKSTLSLVPVAGFLVSALFIFFYPISAQYHQKLISDIKARA